MKSKSTSLSACGALVQKHDSDRFLCALMAPPAQRERLFTLLAFNHEIAKIRDVVSEPVLGQMRLQWWREMIEEGRVPAHEVGQPLGALLQAEPQLKPLMLELLEARERDLEPDEFDDISALAAYARSTALPLLIAMGSENADIATGYALVGLMRSGRNGHVPGAEIAKKAQEILAVRAHGQARYWQALAQLYLRQFKKLGGQAGHPLLALPHPMRGLTLLWASLTS